MSTHARAHTHAGERESERTRERENERNESIICVRIRNEMAGSVKNGIRNPHYPSSDIKSVLCEKHMLVAIFALSSNFLVTMLIVVVNKLLFTETRFPVITLSAAHMIVCVVFTAMCSRLHVFERRKMDNKSV